MESYKDDDYLSPKEASKLLGVHWQTLRNWDRNGVIDTIRSQGGKRFYNVKKYMRENGLVESKEKKNICYCRVSSLGQKSDLENQVNFMKSKYPNHDIITDIGSGLNFNRLGLNKIINLGLNKDINELVIAYKDRLARFGFELLQTIIEEWSHGKIVVLYNNDDSPQDELTKDLVSIINVFSAKLNGMRKYKNNNSDEE